MQEPFGMITYQIIRLEESLFIPNSRKDEARPPTLVSKRHKFLYRTGDVTGLLAYDHEDVKRRGDWTVFKMRGGCLSPSNQLVHKLSSKDLRLHGFHKNHLFSSF